MATTDESQRRIQQEQERMPYEDFIESAKRKSEATSVKSRKKAKKLTKSSCAPEKRDLAAKSSDSDDDVAGRKAMGDNAIPQNIPMPTSSVSNGNGKTASISEGQNKMCANVPFHNIVNQTEGNNLSAHDEQNLRNRVLQTAQVAQLSSPNASQILQPSKTILNNGKNAPCKRNSDLINLDSFDFDKQYLLVHPEGSIACKGDESTGKRCVSASKVSDNGNHRPLFFNNSDLINFDDSVCSNVSEILRQFQFTAPSLPVHPEGLIACKGAEPSGIGAAGGSNSIHFVRCSTPLAGRIQATNKPHNHKAHSKSHLNAAEASVDSSQLADDLIQNSNIVNEGGNNHIS